MRTEINDPGVRDGELTFTITGFEGSRIKLSTLAEVLTGYDKLLLACERAVSGRKKHRMEWGTTKIAFTADDKGAQTFSITVQGEAESLAAQCEEMFVRLNKIMNDQTDNQ